MTKVSGFMHMSVTREYLLRAIDAPEKAGEEPMWKLIVSGAKSKEEARAFVANGPKSYAIGECPEYTDEHGCPGHERK